MQSEVKVCYSPVKYSEVKGEVAVVQSTEHTFFLYLTYLS